MSLGNRAQTARPGLPTVLIVGAGFAGLNLAKALANAPVTIHLVDRHNYHTFQPLLYQVATGFLEANSIANNIRAIFREQKNLIFTMGEVTRVDPALHRVELISTVGPQAELTPPDSPRAELTSPDAQRVDVPYDVLVLAPGVKTDFFGVEGAENTFTLKSLDDAIRLRNQIIRQFELVAAGVLDPLEGALTFAIVGGGSTGVELAGALCDLFRLTMVRQFPTHVTQHARIVLVEALPRLLASFHQTSSEYARELLGERGVDVRLGEPVERIDRGGLTLVSGDRIAAQTVVWVAGVGATEMMRVFPGGHTRGGRVVVGPDLRARSHVDIFVAGDAAGAWARGRGLYPQLAPVALQQGRYLAQAIRRHLQGREVDEFDYADRGTMSTIGRNAAIAELPPGLRFYGYPAWSMWLGLHLVALIGFRNRTNVLLDWAWNYATHHQGAGLMQCEGLRNEPDSALGVSAGAVGTGPESSLTAGAVGTAREAGSGPESSLTAWPPPPLHGRAGPWFLRPARPLW